MVDVDVRENGDKVSLVVSDNGIGIPSDVQDRVSSAAIRPFIIRAAKSRMDSMGSFSSCATLEANSCRACIARACSVIWRN
mgnify:CR=1 FL=1